MNPDKTVLTGNAPFAFTCGAGLDCFTHCCRDVNIFLTPYDVLRMRRALSLGSEEFLDRYTRSLVARATGLPLVALRMEEEQGLACPFVQAEGCRIYHDRPWACRMYPLDRLDHGFTLVVDATICHGQGQGEAMAIQRWLTAQGVDQYDLEMEPFVALTRPGPLGLPEVKNPQITQMIHMALYDLDRFRRFVFETRFLQTFDIEEELIERAKANDDGLLDLGYLWASFGLVEGRTLKLRNEVLEAKRRELGVEKLNQAKDMLGHEIIRAKKKLEGE